MCAEQFGPETKGVFDPTRCPLLQGLTTEEADRLIAEDPRIRACIEALADGTTAALDPCVAETTQAPAKRTRRRVRAA
ncbi:MAG: hypothetical protein GX458_09150 [Phyllobacteriaceae bacterium]|nr:hypothetical protein [Phyllobacteriaceae bacterium]